MASVHEIGIASETRGFDEGIREGVIKPLEKAEEAFEKLERAASETGREGARDVSRLEDALEDARKESDKLERSVADVGNNGRRDLDKVKGGAQELQQEIGSNLGEAVSSFRGDMSDLGQVGQDTLGGLAASIAGTGPAGLIGALGLAAGAAGLGLVTAGMEEAKRKQEELNEAAAEWASAYQESAGKIVSASHVVAEVQSIVTDPDRYSQAKQNATDWGVSVQNALLAMAGDTTALELAQESLTAKTERWGEVVKETSTGSSNSWDRSTMTESQRELGNEVARGTESLQEQSEAMRLGQEQARQAAQALYDYAVRTGEATEETDDLGNKIIQLPDGKQIVIDADTKTAYEDLDALENRKLSDKTVTIHTRVDSSGWDRWSPIPKPAQIIRTRGRVVSWE